MTFAMLYAQLAFDFKSYDKYNCDFACRGLEMLKEMTANHFEIDMPIEGVSVFSHPQHRVVPIRFVLAELCYLLSGSNDLDLMASYSSAMRNYSNDGKTISGAYGYRLRKQLPEMIHKLRVDSYSRQSCGAIYKEDDTIGGSTHIPCNTFLQVLWRQPLLSLHVTSRSSDFVTGFSIDSLHWQFLCRMFAMELETTAERVIYDIASLHIYKQDILEIDKWIASGGIRNPYEHFLRTDITLSRAMKTCGELFQPNLSLTELGELLELNAASMETVFVLDEMFKKHKNNIKR